jgi:hypothetical protein
LTLTDSKLRLKPNLDAASLVPIQLKHSVMIATSTAQNDAGVFEFNFRDERYMPFEGAGAISTAVFDYGEGHLTALPTDAEGREFVTPSLDPTQTWPVRQDPFSRYRACFEIRAYRLCRRVLMFHHFPDELGTPDYLVRGTEFTYREGPVASFITAVTQSGFVRQSDGRYRRWGICLRPMSAPSLPRGCSATTRSRSPRRATWRRPVRNPATSRPSTTPSCSM